MRYYRLFAREKVQWSVAHSLGGHSQFIYTVSKIVGLRPPQFMSEFMQPFDPDYALVLNFRRQGIEPFQKRATSVIFSEKKDFCLRHSSSPLNIGIDSNIAIRWSRRENRKFAI
jgi:hypothetical protein